MSQIFTRRLRALDGEAKADLDTALKSLSDPVLVRSAFDLSSEQRATIQRALDETFSAEVPVRFETAPDVICGIELTTGGRKVAWSIADYLGSLEASVNELLRPQAISQAESEGRVDPAPQPESRPVTPAGAT